MGMLRFNLLHPPFNNPKMRQALLYAVNQNDYVLGIAGDPKNGQPCYSFFTCGTPLSSEVGAEPLKGKRDLDKAKQLIKEAGYKGEKIVIISATDQPIVHSQSLLTPEMLRKLGLNVELQAGDWGTLITRRASKEPVDKGGWTIFHTWLVGPGHGQPGGQLRRSAASGEKALVRLADGRRSWRSCATPGSTRRTPAELKKAADAVQRAPSSSCPTSRPAQFILPTAYRTNICGRDHRADHVAVERREEVATHGAEVLALRHPPAARDHRRHGGGRVRRVPAALSDARAIRRRSSPATPPPTTTSAGSARRSGSTSRSCVRFGTWAWALLRGDLGISIFTNLPVTQLIGTAHRADAGADALHAGRRGGGRGAARRARRRARPAPGSTAR